MADRTVVSRVRRQRQVRVAEGWQEVTVWVPTQGDAEAVRKLAEERRLMAENLHGLSRDIRGVSPKTEAEIAHAISEYGSKAYTTEPGAILDLMTRLTDEDDLEGFSRAVVILARAKPINACLVFDRVPVKIMNYLMRQGLIDYDVAERWKRRNPGWEDLLKGAVRDTARFRGVVEEVAQSIYRERTTH